MRQPYKKCGNEPDIFTQWRNTLIQSLGNATGEIIYCLGGSDRRAPISFDVEQSAISNATAIAYFRSWRRLVESRETLEADITYALIAAGLFSSGHSDELGEILWRAPARPVGEPHGAGHCSQAPFRAVMRLVPLPEHLSSTEAWQKGSPLLDEMLAWWGQSQPKWDEERRRYVLGRQEIHS